MPEDLDERVLDRFVGLGGVAEILIRDAGGAALVACDESGEAVARLVHLAALDQLANLDREMRVLRRLGRGAALARRLRHSGREARRVGVPHSVMVTHKWDYVPAGHVFTVYSSARRIVETCAIPAVCGAGPYVTVSFAC